MMTYQSSSMSSEKATLDALRIDRGNRDVRRQKAGTRWLPLLLLSGVLIVACGYWWLSRPKAITVTTTTAQMKGGTVDQTLLNASGYVTARRAATVSSKVTGKVTEMLVEEGMKVETNQVLARLDASNVEASLHLSEAQLESARAAVEETKPNLAFAKRELKRFTDLAATKVVSDSDLRRAEMEALGLEGRLVRQTAEIAVAEREVAQWKQQLDDTIIRAPFAGVVTSKNAQPGEMISPMSVGGFTRTGICTVVDMASLEIEVDVNESYIHRIQPHQPVEAILDSYPDWRIPAKVIAIIPTADRQKATVKVRVGFDKLDPRILPDMAVKVAFQGAAPMAGQVAHGIIVIPKSAVIKANGTDAVWVVRDHSAVRRDVTLSGTEGDEYSISAGLSGGEKVINSPPPELAEGSRVTEKTP